MDKKVYVRKGLTVLVIAIILTFASIVCSVVAAFIPDILKGSGLQSADITSTQNYIILGSAAAIIASYVLEFVGLFVAGKGNRNFHKAGMQELFVLVLGIVYAVLIGVAGSNGIKAKTAEVLTLVAFIINCLTFVWNFFILYFVTGGCKEVARVNKLANVVFGLALIDVVYAVFQILVNSNVVTIGANAKVALGYVALAVGILCALNKILYIILIFRTRNQVKKSC